MWIRFAASDVDLFHVEFRSIFDYLAEIIAAVSDKPGQVPHKSFRELRNWVNDNLGNVKRMGADLAKLVRSCEWFDDFREVRDSIVHRGGFTIVFPEKDKIFFQIYKGTRNKVFVKEVMFNENIVGFNYMLAFI